MRSHGQAGRRHKGTTFSSLGTLSEQETRVWGGSLVSSNLPKTTHSLLPPPAPRPQAVGAVFLSSSSLSLSLPFFIFKENSLSAERAQLRLSLAAERAQHGGRRWSLDPLPRKARAAGHTQKVPRRWRGASKRNSGRLGPRREPPALHPNSENLLSNQTPDARPRRSPAPFFPYKLGHFASARLLLGSLSGSAIPQAGLRMGRRWSRGSPNF